MHRLKLTVELEKFWRSVFGTCTEFNPKIKLRSKEN